jgi:alpha-ketoglutarate-dependent taurine dioxygenase
VIQVRDRGLESAVDVGWNAGDLLLIDNVLVGHGRRPFVGDRRVLVAMSD